MKLKKSKEDRSFQIVELSIVCKKLRKITKLANRKIKFY